MASVLGTNSHPWLGSYLQLIAAGREKISFFNEVTLGYTNLHSRAGLMRRSSWPTQKGFHGCVYVCTFVFF